MNFWEHPSWIEVKTSPFTTDNVLSRVQYLKLVGSGSYSEKAYQNYLKAMAEKLKEINNDSIQKLAD